MRDLLYKIWDKKAKEWVAGGQPMNLNLSARFNYFLFDYDNYDLPEDTCDIPKNIEIVEYTGVKDKNGTMIFEHDIITRYEGSKDPLVVYWDEHIAGFGYKGQLMADHLNFRKLSARSYTVIGNIYENENLISANKS